MNAAADDRAATFQHAKRRWHKRSDWCKNNCGVETFGWRFIRAARPLRTQSTGEFLRLDIARTGKSKHLPLLMTRHLCDDVCCRAKTIKAEPTSAASFTQT